MKSLVCCPRCKESGRKPKVLAKYEDIAGKGNIYLYCKVCKQEVLVKVEDLIGK